jgi:Major Facilitator Superfamily
VTLFIAPVLVYFLIPESPRWLLRRGRPQAAVDTVNLIIRRAGNSVAPLTTAELETGSVIARDELPPFSALFRPGQLRWTTVGILCGVCGGTAYYLIAILLPKALVDQGAEVALSFGLSSLVFAASIPGKLFNGYIMEVIGRRWTITGAFVLSIPGILLMMLAHRTGAAATIVFSVGALITGFTVLSCFPAVRVYLSEQFPTALRGRGHFFGESFGRIFAGVLAPFLLAPYTASPSIFFGTMVVVVAVGAAIPVLYGRETVGQLETFTEAVPELAWRKRHHHDGNRHHCCSADEGRSPLAVSRPGDRQHRRHDDQSRHLEGKRLTARLRAPRAVRKRIPLGGNTNDSSGNHCDRLFRCRTPRAIAPRPLRQHGRHPDRMVRFPALRYGDRADFRQTLFSAFHSARRRARSLQRVFHRLCRPADRCCDLWSLGGPHRAQGDVDRYPYS